MLLFSPKQMIVREFIEVKKVIELDFVSGFFETVYCSYVNSSYPPVYELLYFRTFFKEVLIIYINLFCQNATFLIALYIYYLLGEGKWRRYSFIKNPIFIKLYYKYLFSLSFYHYRRQWHTGLPPLHKHLPLEHPLLSCKISTPLNVSFILNQTSFRPQYLRNYVI